MSNSTLEPFERRFWEKGVAARLTPHTGWGLFATTDFAPGETIFVVDLLNPTRGRTISSAECYSAECHDRSANLLPFVGFCCTIEHPFWSVNHACDGNSGFGNWGYLENGAMHYMAFRHIRRDEQITSDYPLMTTVYDGSSDCKTPYTLEGCMCGGADCRGTISDFRHYPEALQMRAMLPPTSPQGRVLAHVLEAEMHLVEYLKAYPLHYRQYQDALAAQHDLAEFIQRRFAASSK